MSYPIELLAGNAALRGKKIRLAFFDLDGTLIQNSNDLTSVARDAVRELRARGVRVALATGRPLFGARHLAEALEIDEVSLFFSGSLLSNPLTGEVFDEQVIDPAMVDQIVTTARARNLYVELYTRDQYFSEVENEITILHDGYLKQMPVIRRLDGPWHGIVKAVLISTTPEEHERASGLGPDFPSLSIVATTGSAHPHILFTNFTAAAASREAAFDKLLQHFNVDANEVAAFGDSPGDSAFLQRAWYGVAMGNAAPDVRQSARFVTRSVEQEGVAFAVQHLRPLLPR